MAGEQEIADEYIMRFAMKNSVLAMKWIVELIQEIQERKGGEVAFNQINDKHTNLTSIASEEIADIELLDELAKQHGVQYAFSEMNGVEYVWFKASDEGFINTFLQELLSKEMLEKAQENVERSDLSQFIYDKQIERHAYTGEQKEAFSSYDEVFKETMEHFSEYYDGTLSEIDTDIKSFKEIKDPEALLDLIEKCKQNGISIVIQDKALEKRFHKAYERLDSFEKEDEAEKSSEVIEPNYKIYENPDKEGSYELKEFFSFEDVKVYLSDHYDQVFKGIDTDLKLFKNVQNPRELSEVIKQLKNNEVDIEVEKKPLKTKIQETIDSLRKEEKQKERQKETKRDKEPKKEER